MEETVSTSELSWPKPNCLALIHADALFKSSEGTEGQTKVTVRYKFAKPLGSGSFGEVWLGYDVKTKEKVAIKVESKKTSVPQLQREYMIYKKYLQDVEGFPLVKHYASTKQVTYFVMTLLGPSIQKLLIECGGRFSLKTTCMIADQLLRRLEELHKRTGYVTRDVKPDNLLMGRKGTELEKVLFLIDLGLSRPFMDVITERHIEPRNAKRTLTGTARFASVNAHNGSDQSRRDDLESAGYVFVFMMKGKLPWQGIKASTKRKRYDLIKEIKMSSKTQDLCDGLPLEFAMYLDYCKELGFKDDPDYSYLRSLFRDLMISKGKSFDHEYDWSNLDFDDGIENTSALEE